MREKIIILSMLLVLPLHAYGQITVDCPNTQDPDTCWQVAGCEFTSSGYDYQCGRCGVGSYCQGGTSQQPNKFDCPNGFRKSPEGSTDISDCYKQTANTDSGGCEESDGTLNLQCGLFHSNSIPKCWNNNGEYNTSYHTEPSNAENCYADTRNCSLFSSTNCENGQIDGIAEHSLSYSGGGAVVRGWNITDCTCNNGEFEDAEFGFCHGKHSGAKPSGPDPDDLRVTYITDTIDYNGISTTYYCTRCILDSGETKYYANTTESNGTQCSPNTNSGRVCKCETSDIKGYYRSGTCNSETDWAPDGNDICQRVACSAGKTTNTILPDEASQCEYTGQTKFCDAKGCFTLGDDFDNWNFN